MLLRSNRGRVTKPKEVRQKCFYLLRPYWANPKFISLEMFVVYTSFFLAAGLWLGDANLRWVVRPPTSAQCLLSLFLQRLFACSSKLLEITNPVPFSQHVCWGVGRCLVLPCASQSLRRFWWSSCAPLGKFPRSPAHICRRIVLELAILPVVLVCFILQQLGEMWLVCRFCGDVSGNLLVC